MISRVLSFFGMSNDSAEKHTDRRDDAEYLCRSVDFFDLDRLGVDINIDPVEKAIVVVDDNKAMTELIKMELLEVLRENGIKTRVVNIYGTNAAYKLMRAARTGKIKKIEGVILDITFGGMIDTLHGRIILDGIDLYCILKNNGYIQDDSAVFFYTAHALGGSDKYKTIVERKLESVFGPNYLEKAVCKSPSESDRREIYYKLADALKNKTEIAS